MLIQPQPFHRAWRRGAAFLIALALLGIAPQASLRGADPVLPPLMSSGVLPSDRAQSAGFTCELRLSASLRPGYDAVQLTFIATAPTPAERRLVARLVPIGRDIVPTRNAIEIELPLVLPEGAQQTEFQRLIPKWFFGNSYRFQLLEEGRLLEPYTTELGTPIRQRGTLAQQLLDSELQTRWLSIEPDSTSESPPATFEVMNQWWAAIGNEPTGGWKPRGVRASLVAPLPLLRSHVAVDQLPSDWRAFQAFDTVVMARTTFDSLRTDDPDTHQALRSWLLLGGTLVVRGVENPHDLAALLGTTLTPTAEARHRDIVVDAADDHLQSLHELGGVSQAVPELFPSGDSDLKAYSMALATALDRLSQGPGLEFDQSDPDSADAVAGAPSDFWADAIVYQPMGAGRVVGFQRSLPETEGHWSITRTLQGRWISPTLRRGVDPLFGDQRFRRWTIPGVAQPPVYTFMGLLTAFVILVGPVAYRMTTRRGRGYLMFIIAPLLALLTTTAMFFYGIVSDGFGTVVRVRQLTWVDGGSGDAVTRTRASYFAGIRPAEGLSFDPDAEVLWYPDDAEQTWNQIIAANPPPLGKVTISDRSQRFDAGFLPSRQQRQFVVHQPLPDLGRLQATRRPSSAGDEAGDEAASNASAGGTPSSSEAGTGSPVLDVRNEFGFELNELVIRDLAGDFWYAETLAAGQSLQLRQSLTPMQASKRLGDLYIRQRLVDDAGSTRRANLNRSDRDLLQRLNQTFGSGGRDASDGALEQWLQLHLQLGTALPPGTFVAASTIDPDTIAVDEAEITESIHFVMGTLP